MDYQDNNYNGEEVVIFYFIENYKENKVYGKNKKVENYIKSIS